MAAGGWCLRVLCSQGGLLVAVVSYVLLGALMFHHLESGPEQQRKASVQASREDCLRELWLITERLNVLYERNWTRLVHAQLRRFERAVVAGARADRDPQWGLPGSLLYALTLVTTVGWGSAAPRTALGKAAGMLYALLGAPLLLLWLAAAGGLLARLARRAAARCRPQHNHHQMDNHFQLHEQHSLLSPSRYPRSGPVGGPQLGGHAGSGAPGTQAAQHIVHVAGGARYAHVFQRAPSSPRTGTLARGRQTPHNASLECLDAESQLTATTSASGTPRKCCPGGGGGSAGGPGGAGGRGTRGQGRGPPEGDLNSVDDALDTDDSDGECNCSHDTPSKIPLIWRSQTGNQATSKDEQFKSCPSTPASVSHQVQDNLHHPPVPVAIVLIFLTAYLGLGATIFSIWEDWSFLDSVYFCFITISTIGFGDFAPGQNSSKITSDSSKNEHVHLFACCAYLVFGLVLIAMSFSLVQEEVMAKCTQLANSLGLVRH